MLDKSVLHITRKLTGGAGGGAHRIHQAHCSQGVNSKILTLWPECKKDSYFDFYTWALRSRQLRFRIYQVLSKVGVYNRIFSRKYFSILRIESHPLVLEADIIILHQVDNYFDIKALLKSIGTQKVVWTCPDFQPITGEAYPNELKWFWKDFRFPRNFSWVFTTTTAMEIAVKCIPFAMNHSNTVIPIVIPQKLVDCLCSDFTSPRRPVLVFIAVDAYDERKGLKAILEAWPKISKLGYTLDVIGEHHPGVEEIEGVKFHGSLSHEKIVDMLSTSSFLITPATQEMFGQTTIESLICGTPVISTPTYGAQDIIDEGVNGIIIERHSPDVSTHILNAVRKAKNTVWDRRDIQQRSLEKYDAKESLKYLI
jgi:glycosyltransferase involved in cell wall biosynthesis